jgi:NADPH:quinone reductase-like Zn-dependent oxidoreductase
MKAIVHSRYGPADALELKDIDQPVVNDDGVLVRCARLPSVRVTG